MSRISRRPFSSNVQTEAAVDLRTKVAQCIRPMVEKVGLSLDVLPEAVDLELSRSFPRAAFDQLESEGVALKGAIILDLGAGLGGASVEAASRGAIPIAVEPGRGWRELTAERLGSSGRGSVMAAVGEALPFRDNSIDVVVSLMVLEHVTSPQTVLAEVFRVLKPGGVFHLACENYLTFREAHYRVAWLPLLPKPLAAAYLRLRGRPTAFLYESVTYTTRPGVVRALKVCGFQFVRKQRLARFIAAPETIGSRAVRRAIRSARRCVSDRRLIEVAFRLQDVRSLFSGLIVEVVRKPASGVADTEFVS